MTRLGDPAMDQVNLASAFSALAERRSDHVGLIVGDRALTWGVLRERAGRVAGLLHARGFGCWAERDTLAAWERGQTLVGIMTYNGSEYLELMLGSYGARCAPANFTWRSTPEELAYLLTDSGAEVFAYHRALAPIVTGALGRVAEPPLVLEIGGRPGEQPAVSGALAYEGAVETARPIHLDGRPDDLYVLYTGGTTGRPKGTLWRQSDFVAGALGIRARSVAELVDAAQRTGGRLRSLPAPPLIHGAAQWNAWSTWLGGGTVVIQSIVDRFDAADVLDTVERHRVTALQIVGDAFGRPLLRALDDRARDLGSLRFITSGGTVLSPDVRAELHRHLPGVRIVDIMGSSESGRLAVATHDTGHSTGFVPSEGSVVVDSSRRSLVSVDDDQIGWLATTGPIPLGYLGDPDKTATTFPTIAGTRYTVPGDRARWRPDGTVEVLGRDAAVINSGGEKVFAEEVEAALRSHPAIEDAVVVGRPHPTLGSEVCAVVSLLPGHEPPALADLRTFLGRSLSRYKLPRELAVRPAVQRSPAGKTDYTWAREQILRPGP